MELSCEGKVLCCSKGENCSHLSAHGPSAHEGNKFCAEDENRYPVRCRDENFVPTVLSATVPASVSHPQSFQFQSLCVQSVLFQTRKSRKTKHNRVTHLYKVSEYKSNQPN